MRAATAPAPTPASRDQQQETIVRRKVADQLPLPPSYDRVGNAFFKVLFVLWASAMIWFVWTKVIAPAPQSPMPAFDVGVHSVTFQKMVNQRQLMSVPRDITCYGDHPVVVNVHISKIGPKPPAPNPAKDTREVRIKGWPVGGDPSEVVEYTLPLRISEPRSATPRSTVHQKSSFTVEIPPSFAGRDMVWTATVSHPNDRRAETNTVANVTLPACTA
jgi:hypothetical protein